MFSSPTVPVLLTVVFVATGSCALGRLAVHQSGSDADVDQPAELAQLFMSLAMLAMVWDWSGAPDSASGFVQLVVFGLFSLWFLTGTLRGSLPSGLHLVSTATMVWMVVAMPQLMGRTHVATTVVTVLFTILLAAAALLWTRRAVTGSAPTRVAPDDTETGLPGIAATTLRTAERVAVRRSYAARLNASCHALMNLAMGAVLVAML